MLGKALEDSNISSGHTIRVVIEAVDSGTTVRLSPGMSFKDLKIDASVVALDKNVTGKEVPSPSKDIEVKHEDVHVTEVGENLISKHSIVSEVPTNKAEDIKKPTPPEGKEPLVVKEHIEGYKASHEDLKITAHAL